MVRTRAPTGRGTKEGAAEFRQWTWKHGKAQGFMANFALNVRM